MTWSILPIFTCSDIRSTKRCRSLKKFSVTCPLLCATHALGKSTPGSLSNGHKTTGTWQTPTYLSVVRTSAGDLPSKDLTVTYMPRGRGTGVVDTISTARKILRLQAESTLDFAGVFLASDVRRDYENYIDHESYLVHALDEISQSGGSMSDWRRRMLLAQSLHPTRRTVIPDRYQRFRASEWTQQLSPWIPDDDAQVVGKLEGDRALRQWPIV